jgi:threonine/homoserine/homoserine lactone efflux protein
MVVSMGAMVFVFLSGYAHLAARLSGTLQRRSSAVAVNATVGGVLVALGTRLALAHR